MKNIQGTSSQDADNNVVVPISNEEFEEMLFERSYAVGEVLASMPEDDRKTFNIHLALMESPLSPLEEIGIVDEHDKSSSNKIEQFCVDFVNIPKGLLPGEILGEVAKVFARIVVGDDFPDSDSRLKSIYERIAKWGFKDEAERVLELEEGLAPHLKQDILSAIRTCKEQCHLC